MSTAALTESIDVAQVVLYVFWGFFFGLIFWLRREDRREGYPLESDSNRSLLPVNPLFIPTPKTFLLPHGGSVQAPNFVRDTRELLASRLGNAAGAPLSPTGDPLLSGVGPAAFAHREEVPELTREGHDAVVPMRIATDFSVNAGPDPRGWKVIAADGQVAGVVKDLWIDRADTCVRYLELDLASGASRRLLPITMALIIRRKGVVEVASLKASQFAQVPVLKEADRVTLQEEEIICAFYAGGRLYADPKRAEALL
jgi:photosynthetic reaction center H subunit